MEGKGLASFYEKETWPEFTAYARAFALGLTPVGALRLVATVRREICHAQPTHGICSEGYFRLSGEAEQHARFQQLAQEAHPGLWWLHEQGELSGD